jgi:hypothetical protein
MSFRYRVAIVPSPAMPAGEGEGSELCYEDK